MELRVPNQLQGAGKWTTSVYLSELLPAKWRRGQHREPPESQGRMAMHDRGTSGAGAISAVMDNCGVWPAPHWGSLKPAGL